jgi:hypothetical protein
MKYIERDYFEMLKDGEVRTITSLTRGTGKVSSLWKGVLNDYNKIIIIGYPNSGKTTLFDTLRKIDENPNRFYMQTDDYIEYGYQDQLYKIIEDIEGHENWLVEGIQGNRFLRKYIQTESYDFKPDLIIICESDGRAIDPKHDRMCKGLDTIWEDYCDLEKELPDIIYYTN